MGSRGYNSGTMKILGTFAALSQLLFAAILGFAAEPASHLQACEALQNSVVRIQAGPYIGTGFLISADGLIATASHVVTDPSGKFYPSIKISLGSRAPEDANPVLIPSFDQDMHTRDMALLRIRDIHGRKLSALALGSDHAAPLGTDITVLGFALGATTPYCISGSIAAHESPQIGGLIVPMLAYQGVSVHGLSGSPIFDNTTKTVIGIVTLNLAGITPQLGHIRENIQANENGSQGVINEMTVGGIPIGPTFLDLINVIDRGLANGLGAGVGIDPLVLALQHLNPEKK
jgi:S1-C subfamily serine protease